MSRFRRQVCAAAAVLTGMALTVALPPAPASAAESIPTVTAGAMPTPQVDGIVFTVAIVGNTVYAGGRFSKARPAGVAPGGPGEVDRTNLLAFDLTTGDLLPWAPVVAGTTYTSANNPGPYCKTVGTNTYLCDTVFRIKKSPDSSKIYVGGDFDKINGVRQAKIAGFTVADGSMDTGFRPVVNSRVRGIGVTADTVYVGGGFTTANGATRTRLAAFGTDGSLKPWAPTADSEVFAVAAAAPQGKVVIGGAFGKLNGVSRRAMGAVDATSGTSVTWPASPGAGSVVTDIVTDGNGTAFMGAYDFSGVNPRFEGRGAVDIASGTKKWFDGCLGDTQAVTVSNGVVYSGSHTHDCAPLNAAPAGGPITYYRLVAETAAVSRTSTINFNHVNVGDPLPEFLPWFPNTNGGPPGSTWDNGPWSLDSNSEYVVAGGEFTTVNGQAQQGLTRFAARGVAGAVNNGPQVPFTAPTLTKNAGNPVISWTTTWDAQNSDVTYQVMRVGTSGPIYSVTQSSRPWLKPQLSYIDRAVTGGTYYVRAVDADGKAIGSPQATI
ncbi:delta-60 repeat domain-containing protein [Amycolatopsis sp.]|uniref:delta-60 repeat domain-containing protein n=1 Tax=Amycolatopsis sp. TaxID=37632 RepID=UPI002DF95523|nr:delta-60 repeat domain-containing protein [Amycolatopsis sp.]